MPEHRTSGARSSNVFVQGSRNRSISGAVAAAAIPAVVLSGMAAAAPAAAVEAPTSTALLTPKAATPANPERRPLDIGQGRPVGKTT